MNRVLKLSIDVTVVCNGPDGTVGEIVNDALQELVNNYEFRTGRATGRVVAISQDHEARRCTVDVSRLNLQE